MHIGKISIENIRGFEKLDIDLTRPDGTLAGWTVFAGRNGTGKTTLLQMIALWLTGPNEARQLQPSFAQWLRNGARKGNADIELVFGDSSHDELLPGVEPGAGGTLDAALIWERNGGKEPTLKVRGLSIDDGVTGEPEFLGPWQRSPHKTWFWCGYGPGRRLGRTGTTDHDASVKVGRVSTLFDEDKPLAEGLDWLREVYSDRLDFAERARKASDEQRRALEARASSLQELQDDLMELLNDGLLPDQARIVEFNREGLWVEQNGSRFVLHQLSSGYRSVVALVFDILRRMYESFGEILIERDQTRNLLTVPYEGVILIDEVESHLHVSWQKSIGFWLKGHFPNIQFLVTTHSPFVCQAADPNGLIRLEAPGDARPSGSITTDAYWRIVNGGADDAVLTELFGLETPYSDAAEWLRRRIARLDAKLIRGTASAEEISEREHLAAKLPSGGTAMVERALRKLENLR